MEHYLNGFLALQNMSKAWDAWVAQSVRHLTLA